MFQRNTNLIKKRKGYLIRVQSSNEVNTKTTINEKEKGVKRVYTKNNNTFLFFSLKCVSRLQHMNICECLYTKNLKIKIFLSIQSNCPCVSANTLILI